MFDFVSPMAYLDPLNCNLTHMFVQLFRDELNEYAYAAELAGLKWELINTKYGLIVRHFCACKFFNCSKMFSALHWWIQQQTGHSAQEDYGKIDHVQS